MRKTYFPQEFLDKYSALLGKEWEEFFLAIKRKQPKSFWVNTNIASPEEVTASLEEKKIPHKNLGFSPNAFSVEATEPGKLDEYKKSWISVQEKASMLPVCALDLKKTDYVLDACAAPGMKTLQLSNSAGKVLATDVHSKRFAVLQKTKQKFGMKNVETKRIDFRNIKRNRQFDKIVLDAPCSSEGLVRKKREALAGWSQRLVRQKAAVQKNLIVKAFDYLKEGGEMVYSTCTFAPEENEEVVLHLLSQRKNASVVPVQMEGIKIRENKLCKNCVRLYPQDNDTQQFFFAKIKKE